MDRDELLRVLRAFEAAGLKRGTVRPLDQQDAEALRQRFGLREES